MLGNDRKPAAAVNRELLAWLAQRRSRSGRFLHFLNFNDAHDPYELMPGRLHRFGEDPYDKRLRPDPELVQSRHDDGLAQRRGLCRRRL